MTNEEVKPNLNNIEMVLVSDKTDKAKTRYDIIDEGEDGEILIRESTWSLWDAMEKRNLLRAIGVIQKTIPSKIKSKNVPKGTLDKWTTKKTFHKKSPRDGVSIRHGRFAYKVPSRYAEGNPAAYFYCRTPEIAYEVRKYLRTHDFSESAMQHVFGYRVGFGNNIMIKKFE